MIDARRACVAAIALTMIACSKPSPPDESALRAEDKRDLERVVAIDVRVSVAMRDADDATRVGDAGAASLAVTGRAVPAVDEALAAAESTTMRSAWGKQKRDELVGILRDRKAAMAPYDDAVKTGDPDKMLSAIQAQAAIERRALTTVTSVQEGR